MDTEDRMQVSSKDGMTMMVLRETVIGGGTKECKRNKTLHIMDRSGKRIINNLTLPVNTKEDYEWLLEFHELLEKVVEKLRGW